VFYRLHVISIYLPPLRERKEEIPVIARTNS
jgi:DNA-binding NtrC family response regulator